MKDSLRRYLWSCGNSKQQLHRERVFSEFVSDFDYRGLNFKLSFTQVVIDKASFHFCVLILMCFADAAIDMLIIIN